ncbi:MAG: energy transducer TonB [Gammaproteobacteria bacterium]|nr:energy transducer TonB [Gammaproteobacteria bacterium]
MSVIYTNARVSARDRFAFTLFLSIAVNAVIILGVTFDLVDQKKEDNAPLTTIDVILVQDNNSETPDQADFLAQSNQSGAGNAQGKTRPTTIESATPLDVPVDGDSANIQPRQSPSDVATTKAPEVLTAYVGPTKIATQSDSAPDPATQPSVAEMVRRSKEIINLSAEISESMEIYSKKPKHRYISSNTKAFRDAAYLDDWRRKIEYIGNLNYPEEAKRRDLSGNLVLDVAIRADGAIDTIAIRRSSGQKVLDDAAVRIVRMAAPYSPLPPEMRKDTDVLHVIRTWLFESGNRLSTQ